MASNWAIDNRRGRRARHARPPESVNLTEYLTDELLRPRTQSCLDSYGHRSIVPTVSLLEYCLSAVTLSAKAAYMRLQIAIADDSAAIRSALRTFIRIADGLAGLW